MQCNAMQCNAMQCNAMQCNTMQCYAMQCNAAGYQVGRRDQSIDRSASIRRCGVCVACGSPAGWWGVGGVRDGRRRDLVPRPVTTASHRRRGARAPPRRSCPTRRTSCCAPTRSATAPRSRGCRTLWSRAARRAPTRISRTLRWGRAAGVAPLGSRRWGRRRLRALMSGVASASCGVRERENRGDNRGDNRETGSGFGSCLHRCSLCGVVGVEVESNGVGSGPLRQRGRGVDAQWTAARVIREKGTIHTTRLKLTRKG